jgi:hypothetical protein
MYSEVSHAISRCGTEELFGWLDHETVFQDREMPFETLGDWLRYVEDLDKEEMSLAQIQQQSELPPEGQGE